MTSRPGAFPRARKRFGQHFLEPVWAEKVVRAIAPGPDETFLEIGPGRGAITVLLSQRARTVLAYEIDRDLASLLRDAATPNVHVTEGDFLEARADDVRRALEAVAPEGTPLRVAGNLPYNVASPILFKLIELAGAGVPLVDATVMLQREVAVRLAASPGTKDYGVLTILIGHRARVERLLQLPAGAFRPAPRVQSAIVRLTFHPPAPPVHSPAVFAAVTQAIFTRRRKTLANALLAYTPASPGGLANVIEAAGIDPQRRPETLSIPEVAHLSDLIAARG